MSHVPTGKQLTIFNSHARVQIGAKKSITRDNYLERPFKGVIAGLAFNGEKLLDHAADKDPKVAIDGNVELLVALPTKPPKSSTARGGHRGHVNATRKLKPHQIMQSHSKGQNPLYDGDELILSGDGSGCWDDEDCTALGGSPGGPAAGLGPDDLITPIILQAPPTLAPKNVVKKTHECDDDDECDNLEGSGLDFEGPAQPFSPVFTPNIYYRPQPTQPTVYHYNYITSRTTTTTTELDDNSILYTFKPIPPPDPPPVQVYRPPPTRPTGRPTIVDVPKPNIPTRDTQTTKTQVD